MSQTPPRPGVDLDELLSLFPTSDDVARYDLVPAGKVPEPYHRLLVHEHHMTVTVEAHHGGPVDVRVLVRHETEDSYARKILLVLQGSGRVVQYGIMRVRFAFCTPEIQAAIREARTPLGRILIEHNVLRRIEPTAFLRVIPGPALADWFGLTRPRPTYGRLAFIHCDGRPAIELLEIVAPEEQAEG